MKHRRARFESEGRHNGGLGVVAAHRDVAPRVPVRFRQITPEKFNSKKEFVASASTAGEARESSLARTGLQIDLRAYRGAGAMDVRGHSSVW
jgi:hypothetical protein